jgi:hypothetical protein
MPVDLFNTIFSGMLGAIQGVTTTLAQFGLPILAIVALIHWHWSGGMELLTGQTGLLGDALGGMLARVLFLGVYYWVVVNWVALPHPARRGVGVGPESDRRPWPLQRLLARPGLDLEFRGESMGRPVVSDCDGLLSPHDTPYGHAAH